MRIQKPRNRSRKPAQEPDFDGTVRDLASDGRAVVAHPDGRTFLVDGAWLGEQIRVRPTGRRGGVGFGHIARVIVPSENRREPPCPHHGVGTGQCGGCSWQFATYAAQLEAKQRRISALLEHMAVDPAVLRPIVGAPEEWGYRNRAQFKTDGDKLGYLGRASHHIVDVESCRVLNSANARTLADLRARLPVAEWRLDRRGRQRWHTLDIDDTQQDVLLDRRLPFRQGNSAQNDYMKAWLGDIVAGMNAASPVLELFCGDGNFTRVLAEHFHSILAVEGDEDALARLEQAGLPGVLTQRCDLFDEGAVETLARRCADVKIGVLDPPRDGLPTRECLLAAMGQLETVIYISCDPATWSRDCASFIERGFTLNEVVPVDLFPQTPHVELLSVLRRP